MSGPRGALARPRRVPRVRALVSVILAVLLGACMTGRSDADRSTAGPRASESGDAGLGPPESVAMPEHNNCDPVPWTEAGDFHEPGSLTGALQGRANPSLAVVSIDGDTLRVEQVLVDHSDGRLRAGTEFRVQALHADGRGNDWWQLARARDKPTPAVLVVPESPGQDPALLATLTRDFTIDQPCVYETDRQRAADLLGIDQRELIVELLRRGDAGERMPGQDG